MSNLTTVTNQYSSQGTELSRHTYQTKASTGVNLTTVGVTLTTVGVNLTTLANQHSSPGTKISWHTYQTKITDRCWT